MFTIRFRKILFSLNVLYQEDRFFLSRTIAVVVPVGPHIRNDDDDDDDDDDDEDDDDCVDYEAMMIMMKITMILYLVL